MEHLDNRMIEDLTRNLVPRVLAMIVRRFHDFDAAEDSVQEALIAALLQWRERGIPENPQGWLHRVASRRMIDHIRSEIARRQREETFASLEPQHLTHRTNPVESAEPKYEILVNGVEVGEEVDDTLALLFMCCHPCLSRSSAIALTLRAVGGLTTAEIASAYMVPETTMAQRISRAKKRIRASDVSLHMPSGCEREERLGVVMHVLYLMFNEGYATSSTGVSLSRADLCAESLRLTRMLHRMTPDEPEVQGLLSLMLITDARRAARSGERGELIPLTEQDRALWNKQAIKEGTELVDAAFRLGAVGPYQIQAAIAALHVDAPSTQETDWEQILALYRILGQMTENPMVTLNQAVALAMVKGPMAGIKLLEELDDDKRICNHHRPAAVRAHLYEKAGDLTSAIRNYRLAAERTRNVQERNYLNVQAVRIAARGCVTRQNSVD